MVLFHQVLGKGLAAFQDSGVLLGPKAGYPNFIQPVHTAQNQGIVRGDHGIIHRMLFGKLHNAAQVRSADGHTGGVRRDAAVAGQGKNLCDGRVFF